MFWTKLKEMLKRVDGSLTDNLYRHGRVLTNETDGGGAPRKHPRRMRLTGETDRQPAGLPMKT